MTTITLNADFINAAGEILSLGIIALFLGGLTTSLVETIKTFGIKSGWFYKIVALVFSVGITVLFSEKLKVGLDYIDMGLLSFFTFAMSQGWYEKLENSNGFFGKLFVSVSDRYAQKIGASAEEQLDENMDVLQRVVAVENGLRALLDESPEIEAFIIKVLEQLGLIDVGGDE